MTSAAEKLTTAEAAKTAETAGTAETSTETARIPVLWLDSGDRTKKPKDEDRNKPKDWDKPKD